MKSGGVTRMIKKKVLLTAMSSVMTLGLLSACGVDDNNLNNDDDVNYRPVRYNQNDDNGILDNNNGNRGTGTLNNNNGNRGNGIFNNDDNGIFDNDRNGRNNDIFDNDNDDNDLDLDLNDDDNNNDRNGLGGNNGNMTGRNR